LEAPNVDVNIKDQFAKIAKILHFNIVLRRAIKQL
jgi:hypothetical protein